MGWKDSVMEDEDIEEVLYEEGGNSLTANSLSEMLLEGSRAVLKTQAKKSYREGGWDVVGRIMKMNPSGLFPINISKEQWQTLLKELE